jgi:hypothetical protein
VTSSGNVIVNNNTTYFVDLHACGGNVTFVTSALTSGGFAVYLVDPSGLGVGGHSVTINPITAGNHIDNVLTNPGELAASLSLNAIGEAVSLITFDGTNLWNNPS